MGITLRMHLRNPVNWIRSNIMAPILGILTVSPPLLPCMLVTAYPGISILALYRWLQVRLPPVKNICHTPPRTACSLGYLCDIGTPRHKATGSSPRTHTQQSPGIPESTGTRPDPQGAFYSTLRTHTVAEQQSRCPSPLCSYADIAQ